jgi:hypothetical protein
MKRFYAVNLVTEGRHTVQIVKAETEAKARAMMPEGAEIVKVVDKGPVEE